LSKDEWGGHQDLSVDGGLDLKVHKKQYDVNRDLRHNPWSSYGKEKTIDWLIMGFPI
jgi:hypothetical protein